MAAGKIFMWVMIFAAVAVALFIILLALPGVIELIAEAIVEMKYSVNKLKDALRGTEDGK